MPTTTATINGVVLNEIGTSPNAPSHDLNGNGVGDGDDEFIELYNTSGSAVDISGWQVWEINAGTTVPNTSSGILHEFAPGTTLNAGEFIVVVDNSNTANSLTISNGVYMSPQPGGPIGTPTFMSLTDTDIIVLFDPGSNRYVQFNGEDASAATLAQADTLFPGATRIGPAETGLEDNSGNSAQRSPDGDSNWIDATQTAGTANCFLAGTQISCPDGEHSIEDLKTGDTVLDTLGNKQSILWVGRQVVAPQFGPAERLMPVRFSAGALGHGVPNADLTVTADHGMGIDGYLINASALVNGTTITDVPLSEMGGRYTVYHIETEAHALILANGAASETFLDVGGRRAFDNYADYEKACAAERIIPEMDLIRISSQRLVPKAIKVRLGIVDLPFEFNDFKPLNVRRTT